MRGSHHSAVATPRSHATAGLRLRILGAGDVALHPAWCGLIRSVFTRASFDRWIEWGCWDEGYTAFALFDGDTPVANVSRTRMRLVLDSEERRGWQLGAVCTRSEYRGRGLARHLLDLALAGCGGDPVLLFANPDVREFYPRFGFAPREEWIFEAAHAAVPSGPPAPSLDPADPAVRMRIRQLAADGRPGTTRFGARGHGDIALWYLANGFVTAPREPQPGTLVFCTQQSECLRVQEVLSDGDVDLSELIPSLIDAPVSRLRFDFTPERLWPQARAVAPDLDSDLYVRGFAPRAEHRFPKLAQT
ncbi:MAG: GNAT family N-acetyltransferase [Rhodanobacteraceae bacterium]|nr:GNAT family N-acetyltransferase [Rhodanobacteraceae bacterium]